MTKFVRTAGPEGFNNELPSEPAGFSAHNNDGAPLTRRELRARERAELAAAPAPSVMAQQAPAPQQTFVPQGAPALQVAPVQPEVPPVVMTSSVFEESQADTVAMSDAPSRRSSLAPKMPKMPKILRPVRLPRGISRPRMVAPVLSRSSVAHSSRRPFKRRMLKKLMTFGAMIGAGLMMVSTTIPANAFYPSADQVTADSTTEMVKAAVSAKAAVEAPVQSISVEPTADLSLSRDGYTATSFKEQVFLRYGNRTFAYTNNPNGSIQWPFAIAVPISSGFGPRVACSYCSSWHKGVDFTPGVGSTIQAIADGVVSSVNQSGGGFGNHVIIDHQINGQLVQSLYAHMGNGTIQVVVGQAVKVGDAVGQVGSTGASTGPHLHLEIIVNGVEVDPFAWLQANAN